ncbi:hypothetical protein [Leptospira saintgironsiae]|uniref:Uncharacterized protein n=1 Tax=Leptospira saintgironsiae TaxID=2023183 RepID=A0A2M9YCD5_9LEPT|nr:hypothetical protein [Leptospira saintgironsiae]PJZ49210.1 hypothetical protein CH362_07655 [Leptospira saintgironsiae]
MDNKKFIKELMRYGTEKYGLLYDRWVIFGVRGIDFLKEILVNNDAINEYNDAIFLVKNPNNGVLEYKTYSATIDPGRYWLVNPMNPSGTARIVEGIYKYKLGMHRGHKALNQYAKVTVNRYAIHQGSEPWFRWKDETPAVTQTDFFAIDIHAKGSSSKFVEMASAGCTVINSTWTDTGWRDFYSTVEAALSLRQYICYCVLDQSSAISILNSEKIRTEKETFVMRQEVNSGQKKSFFFFLKNIFSFLR